MSRRMIESGCAGASISRGTGSSTIRSEGDRHGGAATGPAVGLIGKQVLQTQQRDPLDLRQRRAELLLGVVVQAAFERGQDGVPAATLRGDHERKAEPGLVRLVQRAKAVVLRGRATIEPGARLLGAGRLGKLAPHGQLSGQIGMQSDQRQLAVATGGAQHRAQGIVQTPNAVVYRPETRIPHRLGNPGRVLEHAAEAGDKLGPAHLARRLVRHARTCSRWKRGECHGSPDSPIIGAIVICGPALARSFATARIGPVRPVVVVRAAIDTNDLTPPGMCYDSTTGKPPRRRSARGEATETWLERPRPASAS
jgi:hypothetical protein